MVQVQEQLERPIHTNWNLRPIIDYVCRYDSRNYGGFTWTYEKRRSQTAQGIMSEQEYNDYISEDMAVCLPVAMTFNNLTRRSEFYEHLGQDDVHYVQYQADFGPVVGCRQMRIRFLRQDLSEEHTVQ